MVNAPQPEVSRLTPFAGHPLVVGIVPGQAELVARTALALAQAMPGTALWFAYVDPSRTTEEEFADGTVRHGALAPDDLDDAWRDREAMLGDWVANLMERTGMDWEFRYLAGRPDRALTHLARHIDAAAFVVGTRSAGRGRVMREFFDGAVATRLAHHQHRPVLTVPLAVVDWEARTPWQ